MNIIITPAILSHIRTLVDHLYTDGYYAMPSDVYDARNNMQDWLDTLDKAVSDEEQDARDDLQPFLPYPLAWEIVDESDEPFDVKPYVLGVEPYMGEEEEDDDGEGERLARERMDDDEEYEWVHGCPPPRLPSREITWDIEADDITLDDTFPYSTLMQ